MLASLFPKERPIESFIPWDTFAQSVAEAQQLSQAEDLDFLLRTEKTRCHCRGGRLTKGEINYGTELCLLVGGNSRGFFFPGLEMLNTSKPQNVFLEAAPGLRSNALLLCAYGNPTIYAHPVENGGRRKKTVPFGNAFDWLGSENTGSKTAHFII
jgi:hypothetical protein